MFRLQTTTFLLLWSSMVECGIPKRDVVFSPCTDETFFNSEEKCVSSCGPGYYGNYDSGKCEDCAQPCKTCYLNENQCTSCIEPNYLLENRCVESCGDKLSQGPLTKRIRLVGGTSAFEGRLEVFHEYQWGTVCDDGWNIHSTRVVCKELQLGDGVGASVPASSYDSDNLPPLIHLDNVQCTGKESNLDMCSHDGWGQHDCGHSEDVGIECSGPDVSRLCVDACTDGYFKGQEGNCVLCDITCKTCTGSESQCLQCDEPYYLKGDDCLRNCGVGFYGHTDSRECLQCSENCWNCQDGVTNDVCTSCPEGMFLHESKCVSSCVDLKAKHLPIRLVDGYNLYVGRVEVFINGEWGTICDDGWDINDVEVVCRQLGFGHALNAIVYSGFGPGKGPILMDRLNCIGEEDELINCPQATFGENHCYHVEDAGAVCTGTSSIGASGKCLQDCGMGYFVEEDQCQNCDSVCLACEGSSSQCTQCKPGHFLQGSSCVLICEDQHYGNTDTQRCEQCDLILCGECQNGNRNNICTQCSYGSVLVGDSCVLNCPAGLFKSTDKCVEKCSFGQYGTNGRCLPCEQCRTCETGNNEEPVCTSCELGKVLDEGQCALSCSYNKKAVPDVITELIGPDVTTRLIGGRNHLEGRLEVIQRGEWGTICHNHWNKMTGSIACSEMGFGNFEGLIQVGPLSGIPLANSSQVIWLDNVICSETDEFIAECTDMIWGNVDCDHSKDVALKCSGPGYRRCANSCPTGYFLEGSECSLCEPNCESCHKEDDMYTCDRCSPDFSLLNQQCVMECSEGFLDTGRGHCMECAANCATCGSIIDDCTSCRPLYFLKGNDCVLDCGTDLMLKLTVRVRLQGGSYLSGRVEVKSDDQWGTICDDYWTLEEAQVVCHELGLGEAVEAYPQAFFGEGSGPILLDDMQCNGDEGSIFNCPHTGIGNHNCDHSEDAGVSCSGQLSSNKCISPTSCNNGYFIDGEFCTKCSPSCQNCEGTTDLCTSCEDGLFLFLGKCVSMCAEGFYGDTDRVCTSCSIQCQDCEKNPNQCTRCPGGQYLNMVKKETTDTQICQDSCNEYVTRATSHVRLIGGGSVFEGLVEVFHAGQWGTICDDEWDENDATVFCKMLGFGVATSAPGNAHFGSGTGEIWLDELGCTGNERNWTECAMGVNIGEDDCSHNEDAGVVCSGPDTARQCVGHCPVGYYPDSSRICQPCSEQCQTCTEHPDNCISCYQGYYLKDDDDCAETCASGYFGHFHDRVCRHCHESCEECFDGDENNECRSCSDGLFLDGSKCVSTCPGEMKSVPDLVSEFGISADRVRLVGGSSDLEGIIQVQHNGQWGGICNNNWDIGDARVVCRELGFGTSVEIVPASRYNIQPAYPIHLDRVQCKGFEYYLSQCSHVNYQDSREQRCDPNHLGDAAIRCSEARVRTDHYTDQRICRKMNYVPCRINTCHPMVPCVNIGDNSSVCMECPDGTFGDGVSCEVAATSLPEFKDNSKGQTKTVMAGTIATFECVGKGSPAPKVTATSWKRNGSPLPEADLESGRIQVFTYGSLSISQTRLEDKANYTCTLKNSQGSRTELSSLMIEDSPSVMKVTPVIGKVGGSVVLKCLPRGYPVPTIIWKLGDLLDTSRGKYSTSSSGRLLTISDLAHSDQDNYTCISSNKHGQYTSSVPLTVLEQPKFIRQPTETEVHENDNVNLQCETTGTPMPVVAWKKDGAAVQFDNPRYLLDGTSLKILAVKFQDMGKYSCVAINSVQVMEASAMLYVIGPPHIRLAPSNKTKVSGETVDLECDVIGSSDPTVSWLKDGQRIELDERHILQEDGDLKIVSLKPQDAGKYTCIAKNDEGSVSASAYLDVGDAIKYGAEKHIGSSFKFILPIILIALVIGMAVFWLWKKKNGPRNAKYDLFSVRKSSIGTSFTPIYKHPNGSSHGDSKVEIKKDSMLQSILSTDPVDDQEKLVDDGQL